MNRVFWNRDAQPEGLSLDQVLYHVRLCDNGDNLLLDAVCMDDILEDADGMIALDAMVLPVNLLARKMDVLQTIMARAGGAVKPVSVQISAPFRQRGVTNVAALFELSDGQSISIYFHNPDATPTKLAPTDELISWKWLLNKKDITIVVAPERGEDLNPREVGRRIMRLAEKNSAAFQRVNARRAERMGAIQSLKTEIASLEVELVQVQRALEAEQILAEDRLANPVPPMAVAAPITSGDPATTMGDGSLQKQGQDSAYRLPEGSLYDEWKGAEARGFQPNERQKRVMAATEQALGDGLFYSADVKARVADILAISPEVRALNRQKVDGGDVGYDVFYARGAVEAMARHRLEDENAARLNLAAGDALGALLVNFRRFTPCTVKSVSGAMVTIVAKAGRSTYEFTVSSTGLVHAIDGAFTKGWRKADAAAFLASRVARVSADEPPATGHGAGAQRQTDAATRPTDAALEAAASAGATYTPYADANSAEVEGSPLGVFGGGERPAIALYTSKDVMRAKAKEQEAITRAGDAPFDAKALRAPTARMLGIHGVHGGLVVTQIGDDEFGPGWSNGHLVDLVQRPPVVEKAIAAHCADLSSDAVRRVTQAKMDNALLAFSECTHPVQPVALTKMGQKQCVVLMDASSRHLAAVNAHYFAYFAKTYLAADFFTSANVSNGGRNVAVKVDGKFVGGIMGLRDLMPDLAARARRVSGMAMPSADMDGNDDVANLAQVDAAYRFDDATDEFKLWLHDSVTKTDYSPFQSAKRIDEAAKRHGATVMWGEFDGTLDGVLPDDATAIASARSSVKLDDPASVLDGMATVRAVMNGVALDDATHAIATLHTALGIVDNNGPIHRAEGNIAQADLDAEAVTRFRHALETLGAPVLDAVEVTEIAADLDDEDFDEEAEWDAMPEEDDEVPILDGDFAGHPFRGNQYRKGSRTSGTAVSASIHAKRVSRGGSARDTRTAHRIAHHAHVAASLAVTTRAARRYHRKLARLHGRHAGVASVLDDATGLEAVTLDGGDLKDYCGKIVKDAQVLGRVDIGDDGKAMIFMGATGTDRVKTKRGTPFMYSNEDVVDMVDALFRAPMQEESSVSQTSTEPSAPAATVAGPGFTDPAPNRLVARAMMQGMDAWMPKSQVEAVISGLMGEEWSFFAGKMAELANVIATMPKTYGQESKGDDAVVYLHYFRGRVDVYITEKDREGFGGDQAFGLQDLGYGGELGYIHVPEVIGAGVELDFHWTPKTLRQIKGSDDADAAMNRDQDQSPGSHVSAQEDGTAADGDAQAKVDRALFQSVIEGTAPNLMAPALADDLEAAYARHADDAGMAALFERAVDAYSAAMMKATVSL